MDFDIDLKFVIWVLTLRNFGNFWSLVTVLASSLPAGFDSGTVQNATDNRIAKTDILDATAAKQNYGVLLKVVSHSRNVGGDFHAIGQANASNLTDSGVRLLRGLGRNFDANTALERSREKYRMILDRIEGTRQSHGLGLPLETLPIVFCQLIDCRHSLNSSPLGLLEPQPIDYSFLP